MSNINFREQSKQLVERTEQARAEIRGLISTGQWIKAEPDKVRADRFKLKNAIKQQNGAESQQGDSLDWQSVSFLTEGAKVRRSVAFVVVTHNNERCSGTGFLISPHLFITNNHVIGSREAARETIICFDKEYDECGHLALTTSFRLDPDKFWMTSLPEELDYTIVGVGSREFGTEDIENYGYFILSDAPDKHVLGMNVNIIQHPLEKPKMITIRKNYLIHRTDNVLLYETDTDVCSSGSPVCNDDWDLVALHHWGSPFIARQEDAPENIPNFVNEGVRISSIYKQLSSKLNSLSKTQNALLLEALSYAKTQPVIKTKTLTKKPVALNTNESQTNNEIIMKKSSENQFIKLTIPLEVSIRLGADNASFPIVIQDTELKEVNTQKMLTAGAESVKIDIDYSNRSGYNKKFIPGTILDLPDTSLLSKEIAPLDTDEKEYKNGILKYEHFVVVLNKIKKIAIYTATNIDGEAYKNVDRKTGEVVNKEEGDRWFNDPRSDEKYYLPQTFYSDWSHLFDRGHLTRRSDPTWGKDSEAKRANADTFHFTNCSPQHFRFNQTAKFWQGAERYILENGVLAPNSLNRITVLQGPIFDDDKDVWADNVQIASQFFKVAVWKSTSGLKSIGLIVDQSNLLEEQRKFTGKPKDLPDVDVTHWRVPITDIERKTKLKFDTKIISADTIKVKKQPRAGESNMLIKVTSFADIIL